MASKTKESSDEPIDNDEQQNEVNLQFLEGEIGDGDEQDGRYGWVILCASFYAQFVTAINTCYGVFYIEFLDYFGTGKAETSLPGAIAFGLMVCSAPLASVICNSIGHRLAMLIGGVITTTAFIISAFATNFYIIIFSHGVLLGIGLSLHIIPSVAMISFYFKRRRKLVMGLAVSGNGLGALMFPICMQHLIEKISWRGAMLVLACISIHSCVAASLLRPNNLTKQIATRCDMSVFKEWTFYIIAVCFFLEGMGHTSFTTVSPDRTLTLGCTIDQAAVLVTICGVGSFSGRILSGIIADFTKINTIIIYGTVIGLKCISHLVIAIGVRNFGVLAAVYFHYGLVHGSAVNIQGLYIIDIFGLKRLTNALGYLLLPLGVGAMLGPPIAGGIYDIGGSYEFAFSLMTGVAICAGLLNIPIYIRRPKHVAEASF